MPKGRPMRHHNGYGTIVKLSGNRRKPFEARVNTRMDERNYPVYDVLGRFEDKDAAILALAQYNKDPYDVQTDKLTFKDVYELWYKHKFEDSKKNYSRSSVDCTKGAYNKCQVLHSKYFKQLRAADLQMVLDNYSLSHSYMEHIRNLFNQMYAYALEYDYVNKNYSDFAKITKEEDDQPGVPFTPEELELLWKNKDKPFVDTILLFVYSGWRIGELVPMPLDNIDLTEKTFKGGIKTAASKDRIVPIHSKIYDMVCKYVNKGTGALFSDSDKPIRTTQAYYPYFNQALVNAGITTEHTPHDCRHTFATLLDNAGANTISIKRLMGHSSGGDVTEKVYTHKDIEQLRIAIELIK